MIQYFSQLKRRRKGFMSTYILSSIFTNGFNDEIARHLQNLLKNKKRFAFIASEFEREHEKTDMYFQYFLRCFADIGILFEDAYIIDGRMEKEDIKKRVKEADAIWLSGGDTPTEYKYLLKYDLIGIIKNHTGIVIGMSAGAINLAKMSLCTLACGHIKQEIYNGIGCVDFSVEPHFVKSKISNELLELSQKYLIYGLCDNSIIIVTDNNIEFVGEVYRIQFGAIQRV